MKVELRYDEYHPFILETIKWGKLVENIYYARFALKTHKYVHYDTCYEYCTNKKSFVFNCNPIIYDINERPLKESNPEEYYNHPDYWRASIAFYFPEEVSHFNSYSVDALRWEYEIWFVSIPVIDFIKNYDEMHPVEITVEHKEKNGD